MKLRRPRFVHSPTGGVLRTVSALTAGGSCLCLTLGAPTIGLILLTAGFVFYISAHLFDLDLKLKHRRRVREWRKLKAAAQ